MVETIALQIRRPVQKQDIQELEQIDLRSLYPSYEYFDETGKPVSQLRGIFEGGDGDGEVTYAVQECEGYRDFTKKVRWQSLAELNNYDLTPEEWELCDLNQRVVPLTKNREIMGHTTLYAHEFVPHGKVNHLLTQNPECNGKVDGGCGEDKTKYYSPRYHPISFNPDYKYWDEGQYSGPRKFKSPDTFELLYVIEFKCQETGKYFSGKIIYVNPYNRQVYLWCPFCGHNNAKNHKEWHQIHDTEIIREISDELGIELIKYDKKQTDEDILDLVVECPGINHYQISQDLEMTKGMVNRGVNRLKKKKLVRTRRVGKEIRIYPILEEIGTDLLYNKVKGENFSVTSTI